MAPSLTSLWPRNIVQCGGNTGNTGQVRAGQVAGRPLMDGRTT
jgi:hypothetical protein